MKSWKKRWKNELDEIVPDLRPDIRQLSARSTETVQENGGGTLAKGWLKVSLVSAVAVFLAAVIAVCAVLFAPKNGGQHFFTIEINPAAAFVTDGNGCVTGITSLNRDADLLLADGTLEKELKGKELSSAVALYTDRAARLGFLDLNATNGAVRLSGGEGGGKILERAQAGMENYFCEKGARAVVLAETVSVSELASRGGFEGGAQALTEKQLVTYVKEQKTLSFERGAKDMTGEQLQSAYQANVLTDEFAQAVGRNIEEHLSLIEEHGNDLARLRSLADGISEHPENPAKLLKDYWNVKKYYADKLSGQFQSLVEEMDAALASFEEKYGVVIGSELDLAVQEEKYLASLAIGELAELVRNLNAELMSIYGEVLSAFLNLTGTVGNIFSELLQLPQTAGEYVQKTTAAFSAEYNFRAQKFEQDYGAARDPLSIGDYRKYVNGVAEQYGSLSNFWQSLKKFENPCNKSRV